MRLGSLVTLVTSLPTGKGVQADLGQDLLAGALQDHGLQVGADHTDNQNAGINRHQGEQFLQFKIHGDQFLHFLHQQRRQHIIGNRNDHDAQNRNEALPVRLAVYQQAADQFLIGNGTLFIVGLVLMLFHCQPGKEEGQSKGTDQGCHDHNGQKFTQKLNHCVPLLPLPGAAGLPSWCRQGRLRTAPHACRRQPHGHLR